EQSSFEQFLVRRAELGKARLARHDASLAGALRAPGGRAWLGWALVLVALVLGWSSESLGAARRINILAPPPLAGAGVEPRGLPGARARRLPLVAARHGQCGGRRGFVGAGAAGAAAPGRALRCGGSRRRGWSTCRRGERCGQYGRRSAGLGRRTTCS